jgi:hypothetical protein
MAAAKYHVGDRVVLTASLFMVALCLAIVFVFLMFAPPPAHGVTPMKKKISVSEQWLATCSRAPRREECYLYATGFTHALYIWRELAPLTARVCLPETWDNEQAVVATNALLRQHPDVAPHGYSLPASSSLRQGTFETAEQA